MGGEKGKELKGEGNGKGKIMGEWEKRKMGGGHFKNLVTIFPKGLTARPLPARKLTPGRGACGGLTYTFNA